MATNKTNTKAKNNSAKKKGGKAKQTQQDIPNKKIIAFFSGIFLLFIALFLLVAFISFLFSGTDDCGNVGNVPDNFNRRALFSDDVTVNNACGKLGLMAAVYVMNGAFGLASFIIPVFLIMIALHLIGSYKFNLFKAFIISAVMMIWLSFVLAVFSPNSNSAVLFGGEHGRSLFQTLANHIGNVGVYILIIITIILFLVYFCKGTIDYVTKLLRLEKINKIREITTKLKNKVNGGGHKKDEDDEQEQTLIEDYKDTKSSTIEFDKNGNLIAIQDGDNQFGNSFSDDENGSSVDEEVDNDEVTLLDNVNDKNNEDNVDDTKQGDNPDFIIDDPTKTPESDGEIERGSINTPYDPKLDLEFYKYPPLSLLKNSDDSTPKIDLKEQNENKERIIHVLKSFGVEINSIKATIGPTITLYEITPAEGVRITKIRNLEDDIALSLAAEGIRIIAPIPGKGTIGIEVPNKKKCIVSMESVLNSKTYQESNMELPCALGKTITNEVFMVDLAKAPHMLVAGATGMGKSVGLNAIVTSLLYKKHPAELKIVMVDPKKVEFSVYAPIANQFLAKLEDEEDAIITDNDRVVKTLKALCKLMDDRYLLLKKAHVRNIKEYNELFKARKLNPLEGHNFMPYYVVIIDEFGDLIMTAGKEVELPICRIAQLARAIGIHMIIATQRPVTTIITGTIKANFPARIAFKVTSGIDSKIILDRSGANQLIGKGDMLYLGNAEPVRVQCAFVDTPEVKNICKFISEQQQFPEMTFLPEPPSEDGDGAAGKDVDMNHLDSMFAEVARMVVGTGAGSTSAIQRKFSIGYNRAGRLMDQLEKAGIVGPQQGSKPREVLISDLLTLDSILISLGINS